MNTGLVKLPPEHCMARRRCVHYCTVAVDGDYHGNQSSAQIERLVKKVRMADGKE
ncbi:MAG: hypothetical protein RBU30_04275 [Polyangia bacterium]|jgi:NADH:ubiquinone oxidoreductase subunit E|nr:hypothetical protein [Polyangia bacterium]